MATGSYKGWNPFGVSLDITAVTGTVTRTSATAFTVAITASWQVHYSGNKTNYGMTATSGGKTVTINPFGTKASAGHGSFTGTYSISGNGAATKSIAVTFRNFNNDTGKSASYNVNVSVSVPAWPSYIVKYNINGGSGTFANQTKWKDQKLTLHSSKPTRTGHSFLGWSKSSTATAATYTAGGSYTDNAAATLYAVWKADTYSIKFDDNVSDASVTNIPSDVTKTYGKTLTLPSITPKRTNYNFLGWSESSTATTATYSVSGSYTKNSGTTLYAVWELAYTRPRITGLSVVRGILNTEDGTIIPDDEGTYASVEFDYECDKTITDIVIEWKSNSSDARTSTFTEIQNSGHIYAPIGGSVSTEASISAESTYTVTVTVTDENGYSEVYTTLPGSNFPIDVKVGGTGVSFGKPADLDNTADFMWSIMPRNGFINIPIPENTDLDTLIQPNTYVSHDKVASTYINCPITSGTFTLDVSSGGDQGQIRQRAQYCSKDTSIVYERYYHSGSWGAWYETGGLTSIITVGLTNNTVLGVINEYTQIPFDKTILSLGYGLSLNDNYIVVGKGVRYIKISAQTRVTCGTVAGHRHARLCKNRNGTISYIGWTNVKMDASDQHNLIFTPIIVSVTEGDKLYMVFYTPDATDNNSAGNATNGYATYMTVESI